MMISQECQCRRSQQSNDQVDNIFLKIWRFGKQTAKRYQEWETMKHQHRELLSMSDHMLKDIGLSRADAVRLTTGYNFRTFFRKAVHHRKNRPPVQKRKDL